MAKKDEWSDYFGKIEQEKETVANNETQEVPGIDFMDIVPVVKIVERRKIKNFPTEPLPDEDSYVASQYDIIREMEQYNKEQLKIFGTGKDTEPVSETVTESVNEPSQETTEKEPADFISVMADALESAFGEEMPVSESAESVIESEETDVPLGAEMIDEHCEYIANMENENIGDEPLLSFAAESVEEPTEEKTEAKTEEKTVSTPSFDASQYIGIIIGNHNRISNIDVEFKDGFEPDLESIQVDRITGNNDYDTVIALIQSYGEDITNIDITYADTETVKLSAGKSAKKETKKPAPKKPGTKKSAAKKTSTKK